MRCIGRQLPPAHPRCPILSPGEPHMQAGPAFRALARLDALANRVYTSRLNPLYHSGSIAIAMLLVLLVTGIYLLVFYRIGAPYESVQRISEQAWSGRWIRGLHRFASDVAVLAAAVHGFRMYAQRRTWGPRALAWVSGLILLGIVLMSGWTGYVLVWDAHAQMLAVEGARLLDALPIFSEPISRSFSGERAIPNAFFFLNLFAHIALPIAMLALVWVHVARVSRPVLLPARPLLWGSIGALTLLAVVWPVPDVLPADLLQQPRDVPVDWFFAFWLPLTQAVPAWAVWAIGAVVVALLVSVPWIARHAEAEPSVPAEVNERTCTGCEQCVHDCPYDAIEMVARSDHRAGLVARVKSELCTSCGVCIGSCPPMAIGPAVTGRDQLADVRRFLMREQPGSSDVVIVGCTWSAARQEAERIGARFFPVPCVGAMHTSTVETLLRGGAGGVLVVACAEHDGRTREGVTWANERMYAGRKAELKERVERDRVCLVQASYGEAARLHTAAIAFREQVASRGLDTDEDVDIVRLCRIAEGAQR